MRPSKGAKANTSKFSVITKYVARALTDIGLGQMFIWLSWCNYPLLQADIRYLNSYIKLVSITKNLGLFEVDVEFTQIHSVMLYLELKPMASQL